MPPPSALKVLETRPSIADFGIVEQQIRRRSTTEISRGMAFARYVTETIFGVSEDQINEHIVDGAEDRGIDIIFIDHDNRTINIGSCKCVSHFPKSCKNFPGSAVDKIISLVDDIWNHRDEILVSANGALCAKIREIWEIFESEPYKTIVHLFSNQLPLTPSERTRLIGSLSRHHIRLQEHGLFELAHGVVRSARPNCEHSTG